MPGSEAVWYTGGVPMRGLFACALATLLGCSSSSTNPPLLVNPEDGGVSDICQPGSNCPAATYCKALTGAGCAYLFCNGGSWACLPDGGFLPDATADGPDAQAKDATGADSAATDSMASDSNVADGPEQ